MLAKIGPAEARRDPRLKLAPMYTLLRAKKPGSRKYNLTGYIYDVSMSGMRFELDEQLPAGTELEVRATLPFSQHGAFVAVGTIVRIHDEDAEENVAPFRMAMRFTEFRCEFDQANLAEYLVFSGLRLAA